MHSFPLIVALVLTGMAAAPVPVSAQERPLREINDLRVFDPSTLAPYDGFLITDIRIEGHRVTKEYVIRREITFQRGDAFDVTTLRGDLTRIENLGIFSSAVVAAEPVDSTVVLTYRVKEMPWIVPYPKFSYTEQNGWSAGAGMSSVNFFGRAISASASFLVGGTENVRAGFNYPWVTGNHLSLSAAYTDLQRDDELNLFNERSREFVPWVGSWIGRRGRLGGTVGYFQMNSDENGITLSDDRRDEFLRAGVRVGYDSRDAWRNATRGWNNELLLMWNDGSAFGNRGEWMLYELDLRRYQAFAPRHCLSMGSLVSLQPGAVGEDVPVYFQYRLGGANSIRGYEILELGKELYGPNQWIVTAEYQYVISPLREYSWNAFSVSIGLEVAAFVDWGQAWDDSGEFGTERARTGYGVGLRWLVPGLMEIRTDVAVSESGDTVFHLGFGEKFTAQRNRLR